MISRLLNLFVIVLLFTSASHARILEVGPGRTMTLPSQAAAAAQDGDTINLDAGSYVDACRWTANNLLVRGVGGYAHVHDKTWGGKGIWVIQGNNTTIEWIEFSGAVVPDKNGAGIRQEGANLTIRHCFFHDNENGILAGDNAASRILIEYSEFARNGYGDGFSHNMYINHIAEFTIRYCHIHHAVVGHNIKSRAFRTFILCNAIASGGDGNPSREIDLPNGGLAVVAGNIIVHGLNTQNSNLLGYGLEGFSNPVRNLYVVHNTFVTARSAGTFISLPTAGGDTLLVQNNLFAGRAAMLNGSVATLDTVANLVAMDIAALRLADPAGFDYRPLSNSLAVDAAVEVRAVAEIPLLPVMEYVHPASARLRMLAQKADIGALEYIPPVSGLSTAPADDFVLDGPWPNPAADGITFRIDVAKVAPLLIALYDATGRCVESRSFEVMQIGEHIPRVNLSELGRGRYLCRVSCGNLVETRWLLLR